MESLPRVAKFFLLGLATFILILSFGIPGKAKEVRFGDVVKLVEAAPAVAGSQKARVRVGRPIVITFFASWCPPCTTEFEHLNQVRAKLPASQVSIVGINAFENWGGAKHPSRMKRFLARTKPTFSLVQANPALLRAFGDVTRIPTVVVFDATGKQVWRFVHKQGAAKRFATTNDIFSALGVKVRTP